MKRVKQLLLPALCFLLVFPACNSSKTATGSAGTKPQTDYAASGYVEATVTAFDVDGCKWLLVLSDGKKLIPFPLPDGVFASDGLKVWVKYEKAKGAVGTCMAGELVKIVDLVRK
jgi:hypothetical protein